MGPSLARMLRRAADAVGDGRRVLAVSRWSDAAAERWLNEAGVATLRCDLLDRAGVAALPDAPNVVFMAGQKFGTTEAPHRTWAMNTIVPTLCAERYAGARTVAFSTGNVYALSPAGGPAGGVPRMSQESDALAPVGEYAASCVGRERVFEHFSATRGTPVATVRLNYAVDLRYGVLVDLARRVWAGAPVDVTMGYVNVIWQGDANALAIAALPHAAAPPFVVNVTGPLRLAVREVAHDLGSLLGRTPVITGTEAPDALLSDTARMRTELGEVTVDYWTLVSWVADWVKRGGRVLGKPTGFEVRDGRF
jgi:nucleoside-diphosphate-sugar epimerase